MAQSTAQADLTTTTPAPRVINVDKHAAYSKAMAELKAAGILPEQVELRQGKYLNNLIEQDRRFIKRLVKPGMGFFSIETAGRTLQGYEVMNMIRKGQMRRVGKGDINWQAPVFAYIAITSFIIYTYERYNYIKILLVNSKKRLVLSSNL